MASKGLVLITGFNGYLAGWVAEAVLKEGYNIRGTVRKIESGIRIQQALWKLGYVGRVEVVQVPDIAKPGAFDQAVQGCVAILHLASPTGRPVFSTSPVEIFDKAVGGTTTMLDSALKAGPQLRSVVLMSSCVTITDKEAKLHSEKDWNVTAETTFTELGDDTDPQIAYAAAKTAAEKEYWKFREQHKPAFAMTAIQGSFFLGPPLVPWESRDDIMLSLDACVWKVMIGEDLNVPMPYWEATIDVRDVARVVVWSALHPEKADGERFLCSSAVGCRQAVADILTKNMPELIKIQRGEPGRGYEPGYVAGKGVQAFDASKAVKATGQDWIPYEKSVLDSAQFLKRYLE